MEHQADILIIGGGMAGASVAAELAGDARVILAEMEARPGYHTTGRSAAMYEPAYGPAPIRALTRASHGFFANPPDGFGDTSLISPRATLFIATAGDLALLEALQDEIGAGILESVGPADLVRLNPLLRPGYAVAGAVDRSGADIDVARMHDGYLRRFKANGGVVLTRSGIVGLTRSRGLWHAKTTTTTLVAPIVVNAAGAWADQIGALAGAEAIGLVPKRRTALIVAAPDMPGMSDLPLTVDAPESFYLKPDAGRLLISPANENPQAPSDAQPEEMDIALCIDRITKAFTLDIGRIESRWAGLRSFVSDKVPVASYSAVAEGFFWLAGQGGYGIQAAPALARFAASQIRKECMPSDIANQRLGVTDLAVHRLSEQDRWKPDPDI